MKIITRYILAEAATYFVVSLFAFTGLLLVARILRFTNLIVNKGVQVQQIAMVFVSIVPTFLEVALPMAALLGVMLAFGRLSGDSEIVVLRASGISLNQLIKPVVLFGAACTALCFLVTLELRPWGHRRLAQTLFEIARTKSTAGLEEGTFNKLGLMTLYADRVTHQTGELTNVLIDDKREAARRQIVFAQQGLILSDETTRTIDIILYEGVIHEKYQDKYSVTNFSTNRITLKPDQIYNPEASKGGRSHREMGLGELEEQLTALSAEIDLARSNRVDEVRGETLKEALRTLNKAKVEKTMRFSMPFAAFLLALIAMPLGIQPPRTQRAWGATISLCMAMVVFVFYYAMMSIGVTFAEGGSWSPLFGLWLPNIVVALAAGLALWQMGTERWQSITEGIESLFSAVMRLRRRAAAQ